VGSRARSDPPPLDGLGDDRLGSPVDKGMPDLSRGSDACRGKREDGCLDDTRGRGFGLDREAPPPDTLAQIEVQDADVALLAPCPATAA